MSGNYQSRVFTFINKHTNELKDNCAKGLRHLKVAVVWSGQILLYPLQLLAQTAKIFQPQLSAPPQPRSLSLEPVSDINIEQALDLIVDRGYPIAIATSATLSVAQQMSGDLRSLDPTTDAIAVADDYFSEDWEIDYTPPKSRQVAHTKPIIRGLSSLLIDRQLVLVTTTNELLDILTLSQQQEIRRRIGMDLALDWHQWHHHQLSPADYHDWQLSQAQSSLLIDGSPLDRAAINTQNLLQLSSADRMSRSANPVLWLHSWWQNLTTKNPITNLSMVDEDRARAKSLPQLTPNNYSFTPQPPHIARLLDLPQLPPYIEDASIPIRERSVLETIAQLQPDWLKHWWHYYREYLYLPTKTEIRSIERPSEFKLTPVIRHSDIESIAAKQTKFRSTSKHRNFLDSGAGQLSQQNYQNIEHQPDWIEAESETIGYKMSLLDRVLAVLDRVMLQIENWLIKIWQLITDRTVED
jgi:hypothetical protein